MRKFLFIFLFFITGLSLFATPRPSRPARPSSQPAGVMRPSSTKKLETSRDCELNIKTNVSSAEVYINGHYEGRTELTVRGLRPGYYHIELKKSGYENEYFEVELRPGYRSTYKVDMVKIEGYIEIHNLPSSAAVYVDDSKVSGNVLAVTPGRHQVEIKRFGYNTYSKQVYVEAYEYTDVYPEFSPAEFEVYGFSVSKDSINPDYKNLFGKVEYSFTVTASGTADIQIFNQADEEVWYRHWDNFYTWNQNVVWDGSGKSGEPLPDGVYIVRLSSGSYWIEKPVTINRAVSFSLMGINTKGTGIGSMPVVFNNNMSLIIPYFEAGFSTVSYDNKFLDFQLGLLADFGNHFEFNLAIGALPGGGIEKNKQVQFSTSFKLFDTVPMGTGTFCYGGLVHWAFVSEKMPLPYGIDNGNGLGFAGMIGFDFPVIYLGLSTDYIFAAEDGRSFKEESVWKNGVVVAIKAGKSLNLDGWFAADSTRMNMFRAIDFGGQVLFTFGGSSVEGNIKAQCIYVFNESYVINFGFGLSYLL